MRDQQKALLNFSITKTSKLLMPLSSSYCQCQSLLKLIKQVCIWIKWVIGGENEGNVTSSPCFYPVMGQCVFAGLLCFIVILVQNCVKGL